MVKMLRRTLKNLLFAIGYFWGRILPLSFSSKHVFIFHSYQIGGAELVHLRILQVINEEPLIIFLQKSKGIGYLNDFSRIGKIFLYGDLKLFYFHLTLGRLSASINFNKESLVVFGNTNEDFYRVLSGIHKTTHRLIDITHAFTSIRSCPEDLIGRFVYRIVIDEKTYWEFSNYYKEIGKQEEFSKVKLIHNYPSTPTLLDKPTNKTLKIIYVGRATHEKRLGLVVDIMHKCRSGQVNAEFFIIGPDKDYLKSNIEGCIFTGLIESEEILGEYYKNADIILITSSREGLPMVLIEAMAYGVVPISTNVGGIGYHIHDAINGFLIDSGTEENIVNDFLKCIIELDQNRKMLLDMSKNSIAHVKENFSKGNFEDEYKKYLKF